MFVQVCLRVGNFKRVRTCVCSGQWGGGLWLLDERVWIIYCLKLAGLHFFVVIYKQALLVVPFKR